MIPHTLKIGGHIFTIDQVEANKLDKDCSADVDTPTNTIRLHKNVAPSRKIEFLIHEVIHALIEGYGWDKEEDVAVTLGEGFTALIRDNPSFFKHALKVLKPNP